MASSRLLMVVLLFAVGVTCTFAQLGEIVDEYANGELFDQLFRQIRQQTDDVILVPTGGGANVTSPNVTTPNVTIPSASPPLAPSAAAPSTPPSSQLSVTGLPGVTATFGILPGAIEIDQFDGSQITVLLGENNVPPNGVDVSQFATLAST